MAGAVGVKIARSASRARGTSGDTYSKISNSEYINDKDTHYTSYCVQTINGVKTLTISQSNDAGYIFEHVLTFSSANSN